MQHKTSTEEFGNVPEEVANRIANLRYDDARDLLRHLGRKLEVDAAADAGRERPKLASKLRKASLLAEVLAEEIGEAWDICEKYMQKPEEGSP